MPLTVWLIEKVAIAARRRQWKIENINWKYGIKLKVTSKAKQKIRQTTWKNTNIVLKLTIKYEK